jgi:hypothetical protein
MNKIVADQIFNNKFKFDFIVAVGEWIKNINGLLRCVACIMLFLQFYITIPIHHDELVNRMLYINISGG